MSNETVNPVRVFNNDQRPIINKYTRNASLTDLYRPFVLIAILEIGINRSLRLNIVVNQPVDFTFIPRSAQFSSVPPLQARQTRKCDSLTDRSSFFFNDHRARVVTVKTSDATSEKSIIIRLLD